MNDISTLLLALYNATLNPEFDVLTELYMSLAEKDQHTPSEPDPRNWILAIGTIEMWTAERLRRYARRDHRSVHVSSLEEVFRRAISCPRSLHSEAKALYNAGFSNLCPDCRVAMVRAISIYFADHVSIKPEGIWRWPTYLLR